MDLIQFFILIFSAISILLVCRTDKYKKYGYIFGLISQPFWFYSSYINHQYGMLILTVVYTYSWIVGIYNYWIKK